MTRLLTAMCVVAAAIGVTGQVQNTVVRLDPALDALIAPNTKAELLKGDYFGAVEGPVWVEKDGKRTVLADRYEGKRLNSPNDLVVKSDGAIYFTETTSGIRGRDKGSAREIAFHGLYLIKNNTLRLLDKDPQGAAPNGIAFSPDEKVLYVNGGTKVTAYDVRADDTVANPRLLIDVGGANNVPGNTDGMKVDRSGNIYFSGPGGVWIVSPQGKHLGTIVTPERVANLAFGDADSKTLYMVGGRSLWRIRVNTPGIRPMTKEKR